MSSGIGMQRFRKLVDGCTLAQAGYRAFFATLFLGFVAVVMVSIAPVFLKYFIDALTAGRKSDAAIYIALMLFTYCIGAILYEMKWVFFTRADRHNYLGHIAKLLVSHPSATAMRLHRAAQSNGRYLAILFLTVIPIAIETVIVASSVAFLANAVLASCLLLGCLVQLRLVFGRTRMLNPLFTLSKEREFLYFSKLETPDERGSLSLPINAWYDAVASINDARYRLRAISLLPVIAAMTVANSLALYHWQDAVSIGALAALNTYFMQISAKIEMLGGSLREAVGARNQMQMPETP